MVNTQFGAILKEFENFFKCPLEPDVNDSCLINMKSGISVQIELDRYGQILIGCRLGALPRSRYRDNLIETVLKSNGMNLPSTGVFSFSHKTNQLVLFMTLNPMTLTISQIQELLPPFIAKAKLWTDAIANGETPSITDETSKGPSGLFGLISK